MEKRRNGARGQGSYSSSPWSWPAGESLQVCDTTKGVLGLVPVVPSPATAKLGPSVRRSNSTLRSPQGFSERWTAHRADTESDSGVPPNDSENVRGRHGSVKALQGPRRSTEGPHPRRSKGAGLRGAPHRERPKLTTANSFVDPPPPWLREWQGS